jgi:hypothetical protein
MYDEDAVLELSKKEYSPMIYSQPVNIEICVFCQQPSETPGVILEVRGSRGIERLEVCTNCGAAQALKDRGVFVVPPKPDPAITLGGIEIGKGWITKEDLQTAKKADPSVKEDFVELVSTVKQLLPKVNAARAATKPSKDIVESIVQWYDRKGYITDKQAGVLRGYKKFVLTNLKHLLKGTSFETPQESVAKSLSTTSSIIPF